MIAVDQIRETGVFPKESVYSRQSSFEAIAAWNEIAFNQIADKYYPTLLSTAIYVTKDKQTAEDIVQEAFLKLWKKRTELASDNIGGWLYKVVVHLSYKHLKKEARRTKAHDFFKSQKQKICSEVEEQLIHKEGMQILDEAYSRLPRKQKEVYRLRHKEGLSKNEIACHLNISAHTVKNHLVKACQFMKDHLAGMGLVLIFFLFNNLFSNQSSLNYRFRDLYKVNPVTDKHLSEKKSDHYFNAVHFINRNPSDISSGKSM